MLDNILRKLEKLLPEKQRWILGHEGFKRYFFNTGWMLAGQFFYLLLSFFVGAWIARYLGPEQYGLVSYIVAFVGVFSFLASLGIDGIISRELVSQPEKSSVLLGTAFRLRLIGGAIAAGLASLAAIFWGGSQRDISFLIALYSFTFLLQSPLVINIYFYSQVKARQAIKAQLAAVLLSSILKVVMILTGHGIIWLLYIYTADYVWQGLFLLYLYRRQGGQVSAWRFDRALAASVWRDSWPLMISAAAVAVYLRIDQVLLGRLMNEAAVGIYSAGVKLSEVFYFVPGVICVSLFPAIVNGRKAGPAAYRHRLRNFYLLLGLLGVMIAATVSLLAKNIIGFVFGSAYQAAAPVLALYTWSSVGLFLGTGVTHQLMAENRVKEVMAINSAAMAINIALNLYLIPRLGLSGAALASLISYSFPPLWLFFIKKNKEAITNINPGL